MRLTVLSQARVKLFLLGRLAVSAIIAKTRDALDVHAISSNMDLRVCWKVEGECFMPRCTKNRSDISVMSMGKSSCLEVPYQVILGRLGRADWSSSGALAHGITAVKSR